MLFDASEVSELQQFGRQIQLSVNQMSN